MFPLISSTPDPPLFTVKKHAQLILKTLLHPIALPGLMFVPIFLNEKRAQLSANSPFPPKKIVSCLCHNNLFANLYQIT